MDIAFDRNSWARNPASSQPEAPRQPEWHALLSRLSAARAARHVLTGGMALSETVPAGSFDPESARALADYELSSPVVNRVFWADGKPTWTKELAVAVEISSGDRG
jgi:hypothetical protein